MKRVYVVRAGEECRSMVHGDSVNGRPVIVIEHGSREHFEIDVSLVLVRGVVRWRER